MSLSLCGLGARRSAADRYHPNPLCVPSQLGGFFVRLHWQSQASLDSSACHAKGWNPVPWWDPSQNGCPFDCPQRHQ